MIRSSSLACAGLIVWLSLVVGGASAKPHYQMTAAQRRTWAQGLAHYKNVVGSTSAHEVTAQMQAEESRLTACVPLLKQFFQSPADSGAAGELFDMTLHTGVQAGGERWYVHAVIPLLASNFVKTDVRPVEDADICAALENWSRKNYPTAPQTPPIVAAMDKGGISPWAVTGTVDPARTFVGWGFTKSEAARLSAELNTATNEYNRLDRLADQQFVRWLQLQGVYQLMAPGDRQAVRF